MPDEYNENAAPAEDASAPEAEEAADTSSAPEAEEAAPEAEAVVDERPEAETFEQAHDPAYKVSPGSPYAPVEADAAAPAEEV